MNDEYNNAIEGLLNDNFADFNSVLSVYQSIRKESKSITINSDLIDDIVEFIQKNTEALEDKDKGNNAYAFIFELTILNKDIVPTDKIVNLIKDGVLMYQEQDLERLEQNWGEKKECKDDIKKIREAQERFNSKKNTMDDRDEEEVEVEVEEVVEEAEEEEVKDNKNSDVIKEAKKNEKGKNRIWEAGKEAGKAYVDLQTAKVERGLATAGRKTIGFIGKLPPVKLAKLTLKAAVGLGKLTKKTIDIGIGTAGMAIHAANKVKEVNKNVKDNGGLKAVLKANAERAGNVADKAIENACREWKEAAQSIQPNRTTELSTEI